MRQVNSGSDFWRDAGQFDNSTRREAAQFDISTGEEGALKLLEEKERSRNNKFSRENGRRKDRGLPPLSRQEFEVEFPEMVIKPALIRRRNANPDAVDRSHLTKRVAVETAASYVPGVGGSSEQVPIDLAEVSLSLGFKGQLLYTGGILFHLECCIRKLWCDFIMHYNITSIAYNHFTDIYSLSNIYIYLSGAELS